jgi:predicted transcriptional regulator
MAEKRNLTVQLDAEIIRKARILAAQRSTSVSRLVAEQIERLTADEDEYQTACRQALADLETGFHLGGPPYPEREDLYDR